MNTESMNAVTSDEMRLLDERAIHEYGIPSLILMENAGRGIADLMMPPASGERITVLCGKGNNGGDGLVAARYLANRGCRVQIYLLADPAALKNDPAVNYQIVSKMKIPIEAITGRTTPAGLEDGLAKSDWVIDAIFGVGLNATLREPYWDVVECVNRSGKRVVAVDVPSGLNSDTGEVMGVAVKAALTGTLGLPKQGLFIGDGPAYSGKIRVIDIGIPREILASYQKRI
ncbi:MAG: NAD(P)H-hydrate epimerase [Candidatus Omnitrophica bacterium]|nr:NAD(P)H-hydrate epimerase [Candidatus Omnitrophota bacterium]